MSAPLPTCMQKGGNGKLCGQPFEPYSNKFGKPATKCQYHMELARASQERAAEKQAAKRQTDEYKAKKHAYNTSAARREHHAAQERDRRAKNNAAPNAEDIKEIERAKRRKWYAENRDERLEYNRLYRQQPTDSLKHRKRGAIAHGVEFTLTDDAALAMMAAPCFFCGDKDPAPLHSCMLRFDSAKGFTAENTVPGCWTCKRAMLGIDGRTHIGQCARVAKYQDTGVADPTSVEAHSADGDSDSDSDSPADAHDGENQDIDDAHRAKDPMHCRLKAGAKQRGLNVELTKEQHTELCARPCAYCGRPRASGVDRIDSSGNYTPENSAPCCKTCNLHKINCPRDKYLTMCRAVFLKHGSGAGNTTVIV